LRSIGSWIAQHDDKATAYFYLSHFVQFSIVDAYTDICMARIGTHERIAGIYIIAIEIRRLEHKTIVEDNRYKIAKRKTKVIEILYGDIGEGVSIFLDLCDFAFNPRLFDHWLGGELCFERSYLALFEPNAQKIPLREFGKIDTGYIDTLRKSTHRGGQ